jgi:hypothetical protein
MSCAQRSCGTAGNAGTTPLARSASRSGRAPTRRAPPFPTWSYKPSYLPPDLSIEIGKDLDLREPLLFYLPFLLNRWPAAAQGAQQESAQIDELAMLHVSLPDAVTPSAALASTAAAGLLRIGRGPGYLLEIGFTGNRTTRLDLRPELPIVFTPLAQKSKKGV